MTTSQWVYLPDADMAVNLATVADITFLRGKAHLNFPDGGNHVATREDTLVIIHALGRLTDVRTAGAMLARVRQEREG